MQTSGNIDDLAKRIREKARTEADAIIEKAEKIAVRDISRVREEIKYKLASAEKEINQQISAGRKALQAEIAIQERRMIMARQEESIENIFAEALTTLAAENDTNLLRNIIIKSTTFAIDALKLNKVIVTLNARDKELATKENIFSKISDIEISINEKVGDFSGGVIVSDVSGKIFYDNTYEARLNRQRNDLRTQLAQILEF